MPPVSVLEQIVRDKGAQQRLDISELQPILNVIQTAGAVKSIREVERMVMRAYVNKLCEKGQISRPMKNSTLGQLDGK